MAPSFDFAASILLCAEDNTAILDLDLDEDSEEISWVAGGDASLRALSMDFPLQSDDCIEALLVREEEHLPMEGYFQRLLLQPDGLDLAAVRSDAIDWIWKVHKHYKFGPLTAVLSVNYLDRFLSMYELPHWKTWMTQLLAVACLSLAAKMEETVVPHPLDLQVGDATFVFETRNIKRMELLVLNALKWRMQAVTPCSFIDYYLHKFNDGDVPSIPSFSCSVDLILSTCKVAEFLVFRPSEIAASVALVALEEHESSMLNRAGTCYNNLKKERVLACYEMIQDKIIMGNIIPKSVSPPLYTVLQSPIYVLDAAACVSEQSDDTIAGSPATYYESSMSSKRRRICR
ncbi:hypothetical protein GUJ93_ZPchr0006g45447 [Zizania palustris]|uniref:Cyclin N-terminal domain-containing protein n=1 Tax=Zizania palustris TaxID=103762 RepID=A0A8J5VLY9_ZIZPA|nr:hypothetical protein GUJ93_ZPchr0006g45447 [Zizania palustris]